MKIHRAPSSILYVLERGLTYANVCGESLRNTTVLASLKLWERQLSRVWLVVVCESRCLVAIWPIYAPGFHDMHFVQVPTYVGKYSLEQFQS